MTTTADELAQVTAFVQRQNQGRPTGGDFPQALTFGYLKRRHASLEDLALPRGISRQALDQRLQQRASAEFFKRVLLKALSHVFDARPAVCPLLDSFRGLFLDDCTQAWIPDDAADDFPGTGGRSPDEGKARIKFLVRWEILQGNLCHLSIHAGRTSDHNALDAAPPLPEGSLHVADLGFCNFERLQSESERGIFWVTRLPAQTRFSPPQGEDLPLHEQLARWRNEGHKVVDVDGRVGNQTPLKGRLVCLACPPGVVAKRLARLQKDATDRGRPVSERQRQMCHWMVLLTNVPAERLSSPQVWEVYRLRWQVELLFKRFKSEGGLDQTSSGKRYRVESEWYVKLLGQILRNWMQLLRGGPLCEINQKQLGHVLTDHLGKIAETLRTGQGLLQALSE